MRHLEDAEQIALMQWAELATVAGYRVTDYLFAIPNGGKRNIREAARLKRMGVKAGVSDLFLPIPCGPAHGLWIELKAGKGRPTEAQSAWLSRMALQGYATCVCHGAEEAIRAITAYLTAGEAMVREAA